jgi:hypothetical protein
MGCPWALVKWAGPIGARGISVFLLFRKRPEFHQFLVNKIQLYKSIKNWISE